MSRDPLLAKALGALAKANSTAFEGERSALVYGGYVLLARYLAAHADPPATGSRRRERRLLSDRRQGSGTPSQRERGYLPAAYTSQVEAPEPDRGRLLDAEI